MEFLEYQDLRRSNIVVIGTDLRIHDENGILTVQVYDHGVWSDVLSTPNLRRWWTGYDLLPEFSQEMRPDSIRNPEKGMRMRPEGCTVTGDPVRHDRRGLRQHQE